MENNHNFEIRPEIIDLSSRGEDVFVYDSEIFADLYLLCFFNPVADVYRDFVFRPGDSEFGELEELLGRVFVMVGFNQLRYDNIILAHFFEKSRCGCG